MSQHQLLRASTWTAIAAGLCGIVSGSAVVLANKTAIVSASDLETWRPSLLIWGTSFFLIAWVLRFSFRRHLRDDVSIATFRESSRVSALILWFAAVALALSAILPTLNDAVAQAFEPKWPATGSANAVHVQLAIPTMDCDGCVRSIDRFLRTQNGVEKAEYHVDKRQALIWYDPTKLPKEKLIESLTQHGYAAAETGN